MSKILLLLVISLFCTTVAIYADCDLPTGGACKIEDLKKKQETQKNELEEYNILKKLDKTTLQTNIEIEHKKLPQGTENSSRQNSFKSLFD